MIGCDSMAENGRPRIYEPEQVANDLWEYIDSTNDPYIEEFCLPRTAPCKDTVYRLAKECESLSDAIKRCHLKQQLRTMRGIESGDIPPNWGIFKMKQKAYGGFTDKHVVENTGETQVTIVNNLPSCDDD